LSRSSASARDCGVYTVTDDRAQERAAQRELVEKLHRERVSQRGIARVTGLSCPTIIRWLRKKVLRPIGATILPTVARPEIEIDERWSYVGNKGAVVWHWVAVERGTKRVVGIAIPGTAIRTVQVDFIIGAGIGQHMGQVVIATPGDPCALKACNKVGNPHRFVFGHRKVGTIVQHDAQPHAPGINLSRKGVEILVQKAIGVTIIFPSYDQVDCATLAIHRDWLCVNRFILVLSLCTTKSA